MKLVKLKNKEMINILNGKNKWKKLEIHLRKNIQD